ncbi:MAG: phage terminase large subunit [Candidatus Nanosynbacter sp.]|nr:phage terminase large subunit [Candidatus Nanosynbacter sp.]
MTKNSEQPSLNNLTREDIVRLCEKYWETDRNKLRQYLLAIFKRRENIHLFGWFIARPYFPLETPPFHKEILDLISDKNNRRIGVIAPRGHAKSTTVDMTYPLWAGCFEQEEFIVIISDTYTQAAEFINALKDEFENNPKIKWLFGDMKGDDWQDGEFVLSNGIKYAAKGSGMKIRGIRHRHTRPTLMIFDDIENDENIKSAEQRQKLYHWFTKAAIPALARGGRAVIIGTILHFDSLVNKVMKQQDVFKSWQTRVFYAITTEEDGTERALWPEHRSLEKLRAMRDDPGDQDFIGSITFAQEYQHKPFSEEDAIIQPDWIKECEPSQVPDKHARLARVLTIDPAASERQTADFTAMIVADLYTDGNVYIRAIRNQRTSPSVTADTIRELDEIYKPQVIGIEKGALGLVFRDLLEGLPVIGLEPDKDKVRRLLAVSRFFEAGRVYTVKNIQNGQAFREQLIEFPKGTHDDMVDAAAYAVRLLFVEGANQVSSKDFQTAGDYYDELDDDEWLD